MSEYAFHRKLEVYIEQLLSIGFSKRMIAVRLNWIAKQMEQGVSFYAARDMAVNLTEATFE